MLTEPTLFSDFKTRHAIKTHWVLKLYDGTDYYYYSDTDITGFSSEGFIPGILDRSIKYGHELKLLKREASVGTISIRLSNMPYKIDTGVWVRPSDELINIVTKAAELYILCGPGGTGLSDCLKVFSGFVEDEPKYDGNYMVIKLRDNSREIHKLLPATYTSNDFSDEIRPDLINQKNPIVYGDLELDVYLQGSGLSPCCQVSQTKFLVADHVVNSIDAVWIYCEALNDWVEVISEDYSVNTNDSGFATITFDDATDIEAYAYLYPTSIKPEGTGNYNKYTNFHGCADRTSATYMVIQAAYFSDPNWDNKVYYQWPDYDLSDSMTLNPIGNIQANSDVKLEIRGSKIGGLTYDQTNSFLKCVSDEWPMSSWGGGAETYWATREVGTYFGWITSKYWHPLSAGTPVFVEFDTVVTAGASSTTDPVYHLRELRFKIKHKLNYLPKIVAVECQGRKYGSWIDNGGRTNGKDEGDLIVDAAHVIESICRDELALTDSEVDDDSFDAVFSEVSGMDHAYLCLTTANQRNSYNIIKEICEQILAVFYYNCEGKAALINLGDTTPTASFTIYWHDIHKGEIDISYNDYRELVNKMIINTSWHEEFQRFYTVNTYENATSQSSFGVQQKQKPFNWKNHEGQSGAIVEMKNRMVTNANGLYANKHEVIRLALSGVKFAALELGDDGELDATSIDPHIKRPNNTSWASAVYKIFAIEKTIEYVNITAMKLY